MKGKYLLLAAILVCSSAMSARAQNWNIVVADNGAGTPTNQVNGITGGTATLYATLFNFTGTPTSDDGTGTSTPAPATLLNFAGFGFTLNPGQTDLNSLFTADPRIPGYPQVVGSTDGSTPGSSGYLPLGTFDLSGLAPGTYQEDFTAGAYADDINSTVPFDDINGTLTLNVTPANAAVPEPSPLILAGLGLAVLALPVMRARRRRTATP